MPTSDQVRACVDAYVDAVQRHDRDAWVGTFAADGEQVDPVGSPANVGHEAISAFWDRAIAPVDAISYDIDEIIQVADEAIMLSQMDVRVGGGGMRLRCCHVFRADDDGGIASLKAYYEIAKATPLA